MWRIGFFFTFLLLGSIALGSIISKPPMGQVIGNPNAVVNPYSATLSPLHPIAPNEPGKNPTYNPAHSVADSKIISQIQTALINDKIMSGANVMVYSEQGIVTLGGTALSQVQLHAAMQIAKSIPGVYQVISNVTVVNSVTTLQHTSILSPPPPPKPSR